MQIRQREKGVEGRMERERETSCFFSSRSACYNNRILFRVRIPQIVRTSGEGRGQLPRKATDYRCNLGFRLSLFPFPSPSLPNSQASIIPSAKKWQGVEDSNRICPIVTDSDRLADDYSATLGQTYSLYSPPFFATSFPSGREEQQHCCTAISHIIAFFFPSPPSVESVPTIAGSSHLSTPLPSSPLFLPPKIVSLELVACFACAIIIHLRPPFPRRLYSLFSTGGSAAITSSSSSNAVIGDEVHRLVVSGGGKKVSSIRTQHAA